MILKLLGSFEILKANPASSTNNGLKVRLGIYLEGLPEGDGTAVGENITNQGKRQFLMYLADAYEDVSKPLDTEERKGQLRLGAIRLGSLLLWCAGVRKVIGLCSKCIRIERRI